VWRDSILPKLLMFCSWPMVNLCWKASGIGRASYWTVEQSKCCSIHYQKCTVEEKSFVCRKTKTTFEVLLDENHQPWYY
jgi:hypothetical protein